MAAEMTLEQFYANRHGHDHSVTTMPVKWAARHGIWRIVQEVPNASFGQPYSLWRDDILMMVWYERESWDTEYPELYTYVECEMQSDPEGLNRVFRYLGVPWRYDHRFSAHVVDYQTHHDVFPVAQSGSDQI